VHGARLIRVVYKTQNTDNRIIDVSGILVLPVKTLAGPSPLLVYHHGTIFHNDHAPSNSLLMQLFAALLGSQDYIVLMPDYIGYGESAALLHPYDHASSLAVTSVDMLRAARTFLQQQAIPSQDKLFLTGYSEGGYAALATHKLIEEDYASEFTVTASVPGAGSYDMTTTLGYYLGMDPLLNEAALVYAFKAYDHIYHLNRLSEFFNPAVVPVANDWFYGDKYEPEIQTALPDTIGEIFTDSFLTNYAMDDGEAELKARLTENNIYDWKPRAPIRFYHGTDDHIVPLQNSIAARDAMLARAAADDVDVTLVECDLASDASSDAHLKCIPAFNAYMITTFNGYLP
jgi:dipeptidyl aminopeptidase/acylaminoacyl peptidase